MEILIAIVLLLTVVTLVGHGIWATLAWLVRAGDPIKPIPPRQLRTNCPRCDCRLVDDECAVCQWPADPGSRHDARPALAALRGQIDRFRKLELIDGASYVRLQATLKDLDGAETKATLPNEIPLAAAAVESESAHLDGYELAPADSADIPVLAEIVATEPAPPTAAALTLAARAQRYAEQRAQAAREAERPQESVRPPQPPRRPWTDILSAFMEEKNIRWGELVGGLLIVCCSVALVISFWARIAERPFLKFVVFNGVTAALFGLGIYSERRWKLRTTSDGLLITAMLLVPLNFLAIAAFSQGAESRTVLTIVGELVSITLFSVLLVISGRTVLPQAVWPLAVGVMLPAVLQLLVRRFVGPQPTWAAEGFALAILGIFAAVNAMPSWIGSRAPAAEPQVSEADAPAAIASDPHGYGAFKLLGITLFATALGCGFIVFKTEEISSAVHRFAPLACVAGLTPLAVGLGLWRRMNEKELAPQRTAALAIAVAGSLLLGVGVVLAWPTPALLMPSAALAGVVLIAVAVAYRLPPAILAATPCLVLLYLAACHTLRGTLALHENDAVAATRVLLSGSSGVLLAPLALVFAAAAGMLRFLRRPPEGLYTGIAALSAGVLSVALVSWFGFARAGDPLGATWIYAIYAALALAAAIKARNAWALHASAALLMLSLLQGVVFWLPLHYELELPWTTAVVAGAGLLTLLTVLLQRSRHHNRDQSLVADCRLDAEIVSLVAAGMLCAAVAVADASLLAFAVRSAAIAVVWLLLALGARSAGWFSAFQTALAFAASFALGSYLEAQAWFASAANPWFDPWTITAEALLLATMSLAWSLVHWGSRWITRLAQQAPAAVASPGIPDEVAANAIDPPHVRTRSELRQHVAGMLNPPWPRIDVVLLRVALVAAVSLTIYAALPGIAQELSPRGLTATAADGTANPTRVVPPLASFEIPGIDHDHARTAGVWWLLGVLAVALVIEPTARRAPTNTIHVLLVAALVCPLAASWWQDEVATASALRWFCSAFLLAASLPIWFRGQLAALAMRRFGSRAKAWGHADRSIAGEVSGVFVLSLLPLAAMGAYVGGAAVWRTPPTADVAGMFTPLGIVFAVAAATAVALRATVATWQQTARQPASSRLPSVARHASSLLLVLGVAPLLAVTLYVVAAALKQSPILGPDPASWFFRVGLAVSYAVPVLMTASVLVGFAIRERSQRFALAGSLVCNLGVTAAYLLSITKTGLKFDSTQWLRLAQLNAIVSAAFALAWLGGLWWSSRRTTRAIPRVGELLVTLVSMPVALNLLVIVPAWLAIFVDATLTTQLAPIADTWGWTAALLAGAALLCVEQFAAWPRSSGRQFGKALVLITLVACDVAWSSGANWSALHALLVLHVALSVAIAAGGYLLSVPQASPLTELVSRIGLAPQSAAAPEQFEVPGSHLPDVLWRRRVSRFAVLSSLIAVVLAVRLLWNDPQAPWWTVGAMLVVATLAIGLACWSVRRGLLYYAAPLINLAVTAWWNDTFWSSAAGVTRGTWLFECWQVNVAALAIPAVLWIVLERRVFQTPRPELLAARVIPLHRLAARLATAMTAFSIGLGLFVDAVQTTSGPPIWGQWLCVVSTTVAAAACLWDARARDAVALLYLALLLWAGALLDSMNLSPQRMLWMGTITLAAHGLATSYLWSRRDGLRKLADQLRIPSGSDNPLAQHAWLLSANCLLAVLVVVMVFAIEFTFADFTERLLVAKAVLIEAVAIGLLARGTRRTQLQYAALVLGAIGIVALGWSAIEPGSSGALLNRAVVVAAALAATTVLYGLGLTKLLKSGSEWLSAAQRLTPALVAAAACALVFVLGSEGVLAATTGHLDMSYPAITVVAVALLGLCGAALAAAVLPGRDPLGLSENGRKLYVYAAEIVLALLFVHIRLTMPWLFHGFFERYWPLAVMLIAFVGAGVGEWLRRRQLVVVGEPLENTGALLPLLGVLGYWVLPNNVDYSLLLLSVGLLYTGLSVARKSFGFGVLAALAANGGLWYLLNRSDGYRLVDHPQLWLIPPALCVLIAAHLNRRQLTPAQMNGVRYGTSVAVYVSSTADIFLNGVAEAPWLPLVLAGLSIAGIFAGIWLRIRAFLFLGTAFLVLALLTVIWHAAVNLGQTWLWAASGIVAGVVIIAIFAVFEKKRDTVLGMVDQLKHWD